MKKYWTVFLLACIYFFMSFCSPLAGDDYIFILNANKDIVDIAYQLYFSWSGRFFSNLFILFFSNKHLLWAIFNTILIVINAMCIIKIMDIKKNISIVFLVVLILGVSNGIRMETYSWMTGSVFYMLPLTSIMVYMLLCIRPLLKGERINKIVLFLGIVLGVITSLSMENAAVLIIIIDIITFMSILIKEKKFNMYLLLHLFIVLLGFLFMYFSPGNAVRAVEYVDFNKLSFFEKVMHNFSSVLRITVISHGLIVLSISLLSILFLNKSNYNKYFKWFGYVFFSIGILTALSSFIMFLMDSKFIPYISPVYSIFYRLYDPKSITTIVYWILYLIYILVWFFKDKRYNLLILFLLAIVSNGAMLLSPIIGERSSLYTVFLFFMIVLVLFEEAIGSLKTTKLLNIALIFVMISLSLKYVTMYFNVYKIQQQHIRAISNYCGPKECPKNYDYQVILIPYPSDTIHTGNVLTYDHQQAFLSYYKLPFWVYINYEDKPEVE